MSLTVAYPVHFRPGERGRKRLRPGPKPVAPPASPGRVPRIAKLMALAIRFERLIQEGHVTDYAELARLGGVTRARMTQIMDLLNLAPDIQEALLFLPRVRGGKDLVTERAVRCIVREGDWGRQRARCSSVCAVASVRPIEEPSIHDR